MTACAFNKLMTLMIFGRNILVWNKHEVSREFSKELNNSMRAKVNFNLPSLRVE